MCGAHSDSALLFSLANSSPRLENKKKNTLKPSKTASGPDSAFREVAVCKGGITQGKRQDGKRHHGLKNERLQWSSLDSLMLRHRQASRMRMP